MKGLLSCASAAALLGAFVLASQPPSHAAATPPTTPQQIYMVGLLTPMHGSMVGGAVALIGTSGSQTPYLNPAQLGPGNNSQRAVTQTVVGLQVSGLKPTTKYTVAIAPNACGAGSTSGGSSSSTSSMTSTTNMTPTTSMTSTSVLTTTTTTLVSTIGGDAAAVKVQKFQLVPKQTTQVAILSGTGASSAVACVTLHTPRYIVTLKPMMGSTASGVALITPNVPVLNGMVKHGTEVIVYATGLQKNTVQPNHIHAGPCNTTSSVLFPLNTLVTDKTGSAVEGTGIPTAVNLAMGSIHIHTNTFAMESCGDLSARTSGSATGSSSASGSTSGSTGKTSHK
jgi:hypothetical protein